MIPAVKPLPIIQLSPTDRCKPLYNGKVSVRPVKENKIHGSEPEREEIEIARCCFSDAVADRGGQVPWTQNQLPR